MGLQASLTVTRRQRRRQPSSCDRTVLALPSSALSSSGLAPRAEGLQAPRRTAETDGNTLPLLVPIARGSAQAANKPPKLVKLAAAKHLNARRRSGAQYCQQVRTGREGATPAVGDQPHVGLSVVHCLSWRDHVEYTAMSTIGRGERQMTGETEAIRTRAGLTASGKPFDHYIRGLVAKGELRLECIPAEVAGIARPIEVYRARRGRGTIIKPWRPETSDDSYCPAHWADIAIGRGACGFRCRACFLVLTHRAFCDPSRHVLYDNIEDYERAVRRELRRPGTNLGLGIDCSDSLLYEGVTRHARRLIPLFASTETNPHNRKLILLTKSVNVGYLEALPTTNVLATFSLNPEAIADLWEGKWNDGVRITPPIAERLAASARLQNLGFEVRWRVDPILPVEGWKELYEEFFEHAAEADHCPTRITLGTYREMQRSLLTIAEKWGLPSMEWRPEGMRKDGMHYHLDPDRRVEIYRALAEAIRCAWKGRGQVPMVALCKESSKVRAASGLDHLHCNCE